MSLLSQTYPRIWDGRHKLPPARTPVRFTRGLVGKQHDVQRSSSCVCTRQACGTHNNIIHQRPYLYRLQDKQMGKTLWVETPFKQMLYQTNCCFLSERKSPTQGKQKLLIVFHSVPANSLLSAACKKKRATGLKCVGATSCFYCHPCPPARTPPTILPAEPAAPRPRG